MDFEAETVKESVVIVHVRNEKAAARQSNRLKSVFSASEGKKMPPHSFELRECLWFLHLEQRGSFVEKYFDGEKKFSLPHLL